MLRSRFVAVAIGSLLAIGLFPPVAAASSTEFLAFDQVSKVVFDAGRDRAYVLRAGVGVAVVDLTSHSTIATVAIVTGTDLAIDSNGNVIIGTVGSRLEVIDPTSLSLVAPIPFTVPNLGAGTVSTRHIAINRTRNLAYLLLDVREALGGHPTTYRLATIDLTARTTGVVLTVPDPPNDVVADDVFDRVFVGTRQGVSVYGYTGSIITAGHGGPASDDLAVDAAGHRLYSSSFDADVPARIIDTTGGPDLGSLPGEGWSWDIAADPARDRVFVLRPGRLQVFEHETLVQQIPLLHEPSDLGIDPTTGDVWVIDPLTGGVWIVDLAPAATPRSGFVTRVGGDLFVDGQPYRFTGVNLYNANSNGSCRDELDDATLDQALMDTNLEWSGHGVIRAWFFQTLATDSPSGARNWTKFDRLLEDAARRGYKVIPTLADQWGECGAQVAPTYAFKTEAWYTAGYKAPDPLLAAAHGGNWESYKNWVAEVVTRYKDDPTVAFWQLMNEAEVNPGGKGGTCPAGDGPRDTLMAFASDVSGLVKSIDPDHLLSLGTIGGGQCGTSGPQYQDVHALPNIDLCEYHDYTPNEAIPGDQWNGLGVRIDQCAALDKPLFVGETGIRPIDTGGTFDDRAVALRAKVATQFRLGIDGMVAWDYSPAGSTLDDYDLGPYDPAIVFGLTPGTAPSPFIVTTTDDVNDGACDASHCSLREAILAADEPTGLASIIGFDIPGPAPHTIRPTTPLPPLTRAILVDGTSQPDFAAGAPTVVLSGVDGPVGDGLRIEGPDVSVRGLVINGFGGSAIHLVGGGSSMITGNWIGTDVTGATAVRHPSGHADVGILIEDSVQNQVGGATGGDPNLVAGNDVGILLTGSSSTNNRIIGNLIGSDPSGGTGAGNASSGVRIAQGAGGTIVGGTGSGEGNLIAGSGGDGVAVVDDTTVGNIINGNSIHDNGGLGIDLGDDGVDPTPPAILNPTTGPNRHQGRPMIDVITGDVVSGRVWGFSGQIHLEFFRSTSCDPSHNGEGEHFLGSTDVTTAGNPPFSTFTWTSPTPTPLQPTDIVTATATSAAGTSEFSPCWPGPTNGGDTPVGTDVVTQPTDSTTGTSPVVLGFANVTTAGTTSLVTSDTGPAVPTGFALGDPATYFDVSTTATFSGSVDICISYTDIAFIDPAGLRLYHYDTGLGSWVDVTGSVDTVAQQVCGTVTSLSPFALVQTRPAFTSSASTTMTVGTNSPFTITTSGFRHPTLTAVGSLPSGVTLTDHGDGTAAFAGAPATAAGAVYPMTLRGSEAGVSIDQAFTLTVREAPGFTSAATTTFTIDVPGTFTVATRGYPRPTITKTGSLPSGLSFNVSTGVLAGTPTANTAGTYKLTLKATNGVGSVAQQVLTVTVLRRASSVTATCVPDPTVPGTATTCTATIRDAGAGTASTPTGSISWSIVTGSGKFSGASCKTQNGMRVCTTTYTAGLAQTADQRLRASAPADTNHDASSGDVTSRLTVTVLDAYTTPRNVTLDIAPPGVLANDRNTTGGAVALLAGPGHGILTLRTDGSFSYVPARNFHGKDAFGYRVRVGSTWSLPTAVTITVS